MASVSPVESRAILVSTLKRALHGPDGPWETAWPGSTSIPLTVEAGATLTKEMAHLALQNDLGEEVLRVSPSRLYGIGVLYPQLSEDEEARLSADQESLTDDNAQDELPPTEIPEGVSASSDNDEPAQVSESGQRPRSIAFTCHLPLDVTCVELTISGGRYSRLPVVRDGQALDFWQRSSVKKTISLSIDRNQHATVADVPGPQLLVGVDVRPSANGKLCTFYLLNEATASGDIASHCFFQARISILTPQCLPYPSSEVPELGNESFELLYRAHPVFAIGHGCDASTKRVSGGYCIQSETLPVVELDPVSPNVRDGAGNSYGVGMGDLAEMNAAAVTSVERIISDYDHWIKERRKDAKGIATPLEKIADVHLSACEQFLVDVRAGWQLVHQDAEVRQSLQWASHCMNLQRRVSDLPLRKVVITGRGSARTITVEPASVAPERQAVWRPFQVAYLLASIPSTVDIAHPRRDQVDIIWMPTGGGKTEAYLGLAAFTILWNRRQRILHRKLGTPSVDVLMRYTLRLLTAQQVQRSAALICAMEQLRRSAKDLLGERPFRIGAYLGRASTPNTRKDAIKLWGKLDSSGAGQSQEQTFLLTRCPWCGAQMGPVEGGLAGYLKVSTSKGDVRVQAFCPDTSCPFSHSGDAANPGGLPVLEVDEDIYAIPPAFLVGTIDKFAQLSWRPKARSLFGLSANGNTVERKAPAPSLFIQDELHLISGPLGSLDSLYEVALEELCLLDGGTKPKIIAATATTRDFETQTLRLYGRPQSRLVPPPALDAEDSFFATLDKEQPSKIFLGVCAPGFGNTVQAQLRTLAALVHAGGVLDVMDATFDPWWTNLSFFSSRRSLGLQLAACQTGLDTTVFAMSAASGMRVGKLSDKGTRSARRSIRPIKELTATSRDNVTQLLAQLALERHDKGSIDICFATSMIEVGVDVPRLGLMTVMGQPKNYSQYIQVTGRVGRSASGPGLVVVVLSPYNVRDRSHYETFTATHQRLYAAVEPVSITPFTPQSLERGLAGAYTALLRTTTNLVDPTPLLSPDTISTGLEPWQRRARAMNSPRALQVLAEETARLQRNAKAATSSALALDWDGDIPEARNPFLRAAGELDAADTYKSWQIPRSMRSVDAEAGVRIPRGVAPTSARRPTSSDVEEDF